MRLATVWLGAIEKLDIETLTARESCSKRLQPSALAMAERDLSFERLLGAFVKAVLGASEHIAKS